MSAADDRTERAARAIAAWSYDIGGGPHFLADDDALPNSLARDLAAAALAAAGPDPEVERLRAEVRRAWAAMTLPEGDVADALAERDAARAEVAALREAIEGLHPVERGQCQRCMQPAPCAHLAVLAEHGGHP